MRVRQRVIGLPAVAVLAILAVAPALSGPQEGARRVSVGILPVYDASGDTFGETFVQQLTFMVYEELRDTAIEPVLLNPGGAYSPDGVEWIQDYAQRYNVDAVLIGVMLRSDRPRKGEWTIRVESQLYAMRSGQRGSPTQHVQTIDRKDAGVEVGISDPRFYGPSRPFEKQKLGKLARRLAKEIKEKVVREAATIAPGGGTPAPVASRKDVCEIKFRVLYADRKAASKSYTLMVNGREESFEIRDGVATVDVASGPVVLHVAVNDAPYKLAIQRIYMASVNANCAQPERTLVMEIGSAGEAFLSWR
jgi:hypothetical protein